MSKRPGLQSNAVLQLHVVFSSTVILIRF